MLESGLRGYGPGLRILKEKAKKRILFGRIGPKDVLTVVKMFATKSKTRMEKEASSRDLIY